MLHNMPTTQKRISQMIYKCLFIVTFDENRSLQQSSFMVDVILLSKILFCVTMILSIAV